MNVSLREPGVDDDARHGVRQRDVGAHVETEPAIGPLGGRRASRIDDVQTRTRRARPSARGGRRSGGSPRVRAPEEDHVRLLRFAVGARPSACSKDRRQTDDARGVSRSVAAIDVVRAERHARELLRQEVHLVARLRAREDSQRVATVPVDDSAKSGRGRSRASSQVAVRSTPLSRTSGSTKRVYPNLVGLLRSSTTRQRARSTTAPP